MGIFGAGGRIRGHRESLINWLCLCLGLSFTIHLVGLLWDSVVLSILLLLLELLLLLVGLLLLLLSVDSIVGLVLSVLFLSTIKLMIWIVLSTATSFLGVVVQNADAVETHQYKYNKIDANKDP